MDQHNSIPHGIRDKYLFSEPKELMRAVTITHIVSIDQDRILVSQDGFKTCIYTHKAHHRKPFTHDNWKQIVHLTEIDNQRITTSCVAKDYFILANDDCHFYMFDNIGYKIVD